MVLNLLSPLILCPTPVSKHVMRWKLENAIQHCKEVSIGTASVARTRTTFDDNTRATTPQQKQFKISIMPKTSKHWRAY